MNAQLVNKRPEEMSREEFVKSWENIGYTLSALHKVLLEQKESLMSIKSDDFDCPNHYAKLAYQAGQVEQINYILNILPKSSKF